MILVWPKMPTRTTDCSRIAVAGQPVGGPPAPARLYTGRDPCVHVSVSHSYPPGLIWTRADYSERRWTVPATRNLTLSSSVADMVIYWSRLL